MDPQQLLDSVAQFDTWLSGQMDGLSLVVGGLLSGIGDDLTGWIDGLTPDQTAPQRLRSLTMWLAGQRDFGASLLYDRLALSINGAIERIANYFSDLLDTPFKGSAELGTLARELGQQAHNLLSTTVVSNLQQALTTALTTLVLTRSAPAAYRAVVPQLLSETSVAFRSLEASVETALYTFVRAYSDTAAHSLKLTHYYYMGTQITSTRDFCKQRIGQTFSEKQVKGWAALDWSGKQVGTTEETIFWYCGGYRCRHRLLPVTLRVKNFLLNK